MMPDPEKVGQMRRGIKGTAFVVGKNGLLATNAHVYNEIPKNERQFMAVNLISATNDNGLETYTRYPIELKNLDNENDLAIFKATLPEGLNPEPIKLGQLKGTKEGDEILLAGHPLATELIIMGVNITLLANQCIVSALKRRADDGSLVYFLVDTHINLGSSGSPVFSKETGEVIGVASGRIGMNIPLPNQKPEDLKNFQIPANIGICRPVEYLKELINKS